MHSRSPLSLLLITISLLLFALIGYSIGRHETLPLFACYFSLFGIYAYLINQMPAFGNKGFNFWIAAALLYRLIFLFSVPSLSDDFYRFIWDGRLLAAGVSPFTQVPSYYMEASNAVAGLDAELFEKLNSKHRFSSYPPVCQLIYWAAAQSTESIFASVIMLKIILLFFEAGTFWIMIRLLRIFQLSKSTFLIYALNPLVIVEIMGNVHFEGVMIFFLMLAIYFLSRDKYLASTATFALSICTKLIPLLFLPLLARLLGWRLAFRYWMLTAFVTLLLFVPLIEKDIIAGFSTSLGYYFQRFEFNASVYYLVRHIGFLIFGFNIIQFAGPILALTAASLILWISFNGSNSLPLRDNYHQQFRAMLWCLFVYFISTTILHPWYIITLLALSLFTPYRFPVLWTGLIFLTYAGYTENSFQENIFLVALEYIVLFSYILFETVWQRPKSHS
jgi:hypothetical protein